jgi:hypothetical protein
MTALTVLVERWEYVELSGGETKVALYFDDGSTFMLETVEAEMRYGIKTETVSEPKA